MRCDLPVGTIVKVTPFPARDRMPYRGRVVGYDISRTKYFLSVEFMRGKFTSEGVAWAFPGECEEERSCAFTDVLAEALGIAADNHSADLIEVWHGAPTPLSVCGYHASRADVMRHVYAAKHAARVAARRPAADPSDPTSQPTTSDAAERR